MSELNQVRLEPSDNDFGTQARARRDAVEEALRSGVTIDALMNSSLGAATKEYFQDANAYHPGDETLPEQLRRLDGDIY